MKKALPKNLGIDFHGSFKRYKYVLRNQTERAAQAGTKFHGAVCNSGEHAVEPSSDDERRRCDGFYKHWQGRTGVYATYSDSDDGIEFGLSERHGYDSKNLLMASLVLDDELGELDVIHKMEKLLNFDCEVNPGRAEPLTAALAYSGRI